MDWAIIFVTNEDKANGEIFIATDGKPHSSREIYDAMRNVMGKSILTWSIPKFLFNLVSLINKNIESKVNKLLGDECYSSEKLQSIGFSPKKSLKDMNETSY